ncbi:MAG: TetR/AcrR family transcriptional regulator [Anaerolineae bacterium]|jgi:AcrR family transcriptional regulator
MSEIPIEESTRDRVIQAAHQLFIERGYHGASMRQIAERAKIALGGIYNHFSGKEDILAAVMVERNPYHDIVPALEAARGETAEALVRSAAAGMLAALRNRPDDLQLLFVEIVEFKGQHFPELFESLFPQMIGFAQRLVQMNGDLRPIPPPTLLRAFVGFFFAYFMTEWLMGDQFALESQQSAFDDFVNIYLHGVLKS